MTALIYRLKYNTDPTRPSVQTVELIGTTALTEDPGPTPFAVRITEPNGQQSQSNCPDWDSALNLYNSTPITK